MRGTIGGRYALYGEIASGGMATVHLGRLVGAVGFARIVAIKRLHPQLRQAIPSSSRCSSTRRGSRRASGTRTSSRRSTSSRASGELFLVMEYVHGESLARLIAAARTRERRDARPRSSPRSWPARSTGCTRRTRRRARRGEPLGIVHRDVSPQNILVGTDGVARVLDFGVAKAAGRVQTTREGQLKGKLAYMAPEQLASQPRRSAHRRLRGRGRALGGAHRAKLFEGDNEGAVLNQILLEAPVGRRAP